MRCSFAEEHPVVLRIRSVIKNTMKRGYFARKSNGRYSDCLVYIVSGEAYYHFDSYDVQADGGSVLYLPQGGVYSIDVVSENYDVVFVDFDFRRDGEEEFVCECIHNMSRQTKNYFDSMYRAWIAKKGDYLELCMAEVYKILADMISAKEIKYYSNKNSSVIQPSVDYMKENFCNRDISIDKIAAASGISRGHFGRLFSMLYKVGPKKYLDLLRIERAKELLINDELTLSEIAGMCGYSDVYYFSKAFKKEIGTSPGTYRKNVK